MSDKSFQIEEVSEAAPVPKAPPLRAMEERSPDYLEGFLAKKAESTPEEAPGGELYEVGDRSAAPGVRPGNPGQHL